MLTQLERREDNGRRFEVFELSVKNEIFVDPQKTSSVCHRTELPFANMPVRIRLASHPLARKKEPLYHIVVAKSKYPLYYSGAHNYRTGRQRKPLEVVGVYDPIPRHPTTPTGEVLEDEPKIKKISMNMDRVRYWLSVGAQPSNHCARLLTKVSLK